MFWNGIEREPPHLIELVRFVISYLCRVHERSERKDYPMRFSGISFPDYVVISEEFVFGNASAVFFPYFALKSIFHGLAYLQLAGPAIPPPLLVSAVLAPLIH